MRTDYQCFESKKIKFVVKHLLHSPLYQILERTINISITIDDNYYV